MQERQTLADTLKCNFVSNGRTNSDISVITTDNGAVWAYGINENGIIGDGTTVDRYEPARVGTAYFLFDKYTYSLRVDDEEPKTSCNILQLVERCRRYFQQKKLN